VKGSRHSAMRELRVQRQGHSYRMLYLFDPRRVALLLLGDDKTGDGRWYEKNVPLADRIYDSYLARWCKKTMPKTTKFNELRATMSPEARAEARRLADEDLRGMPCTNCPPPGI
jgi:uncharacterized protein YhbP (UPF0306 family)